MFTFMCPDTETSKSDSVIQYHDHIIVLRCFFLFSWSRKKCNCVGMEKRLRHRKHKRSLRRLSIREHYHRVIELCTDYLAETLAISNCIDRLIFAHTRRMDRLYWLTASFIDVNFESVFTSDEFFELSVDQMITLLPLLIYDEMSETNMENALILWSKYKRVEQKRQIGLMR